MNFDALVLLGEAEIDRAIADRDQESLTLDFKAETVGGNVWVREGRLTADFRKPLAKALSAFSNSAGGIVVLGVDCRPDAAGIDGAGPKLPINNLSRFLTLVQQAIGDLLQPKHSGIKLQAIATAADPTAGFIVIDVPRSERRPHRSEAVDQKLYFKRVGSQSIPMEHYDIEDAFNRRSAPDLIPSFSLSTVHTSGHATDLRVDLRLEVHLANESDVTARHPSMVFTIISGSKLETILHEKLQPMTAYNRAQDIVITAASGFVINPGEMRTFEQFLIKIRILNRTEIWDEGRPQAEYKVKYSLFAEDTRMKSGVLTISLDDLLSASKSKEQWPLLDIKH